jgi:hypothetical protein
MASNPAGIAGTTEGEGILAFAKTFSENDGRGVAVEAGMGSLKESCGGGKVRQWYIYV